MKKTGNLLSAAVAATIILGTTGCGSIRDYSVNSYQGVMPMSDFRPTTAVTTTTTTTTVSETPKPSVPTPAPTAAPAAGASGSSTTKPGDASTK